MAFATVSLWKMNSELADMDAVFETMQRQYMPAIKAMGAEQSMMIRTSVDTSAIITVYPDEATREAALDKIMDMREKGTGEFDTVMTGELKGDVVASI